MFNIADGGFTGGGVLTALCSSLGLAHPMGFLFGPEASFRL